MLYDVIIIGGGIVGLSTAWQLKQRYPDQKILTLEKESQLAYHQTGHNSGVIHAGVYYQPGSLKAQFCKRGAAQTIDFCKEHRLPYAQCGKLLVATDALEFERMSALEIRCGQNGIKTQRLTEAELRKHEPAISGCGALYVPATGITDYTAITNKIAYLFKGLGGKVKLSSEVMAIQEHTDRIDIELKSEIVSGRHVVVCGGLMADRLARMMQIDIDFAIIPFRGEYYKLADKHRHIIQHLIYPIPDPELPFLGVHLTRMIDGAVTVGPNAVLGWRREGYATINIDLKDIREMIAFPGFWKVLRSNLKSGIEEFRDSLYRPGYLQRIQKYCPQLQLSDLKPYPPGIRAQAVMKNGSLVHDFLFAESRRSLHVCNAPSPAATSAFPIGEYLCQKVTQKIMS
jgi:L-2-hydroxyglutarate oxidase